MLLHKMKFLLEYDCIRFWTRKSTISANHLDYICNIKMMTKMVTQTIAQIQFFRGIWKMPPIELECVDSEGRQSKSSDHPGCPQRKYCLHTHSQAIPTAPLTVKFQKLNPILIGNFSLSHKSWVTIVEPKCLWMAILSPRKLFSKY